MNVPFLEVVERHGGGKVDGPIIRNQKELPSHTEKPKLYLSIFGEIEIWRAYYWKEGEKGFFPLDADLNMPQRKYSHLLEKWIQADIAEDPYEKVVGRYAELLNIPVSKLGQENMSLESSDAFDTFYQQKPPFDPEIEGDIIGVEADGKGVRMIPSEREENTEEKTPKPRRGKGEKSSGLRREAVSTADFTFNPEPRTPAEMTEFLMKEVTKEKELQLKAERKSRHQSDEAEPRQALNVQVAATMYGKQTAFERLADQVRRRDPRDWIPPGSVCKFPCQSFSSPSCVLRTPYDLHNSLYTLHLSCSNFRSLQQAQHSIRVADQALPDRDFHPARSVRLRLVR